MFKFWVLRWVFGVNERGQVRVLKNVGRDSEWRLCFEWKRTRHCKNELEARPRHLLTARECGFTD